VTVNEFAEDQEYEVIKKKTKISKKSVKLSEFDERSFRKSNVYRIKPDLKISLVSSSYINVMRKVRN
jgi:hypothetical protein